MPNWICGDLKVRGTRENIEKFLLEGLQPVSIWGASGEEIKVTKDEYEMNIQLERSTFHLKGTRRQFIDNNSITFYYDDDRHKQVLVLEDFQGAWCIDVDGLTNLSQEFEVDFKILGFERGMQFNQDIEIINGVVEINQEISFNDYEWECIRPHIGG